MGNMGKGKGKGRKVLGMELNKWEVGSGKWE